MTLYHFKKHGQYADGFKYTNHTYAFINSWGFWFSRKGNEICWRWPWTRKGYADGSGRSPWFVSDLGGFNTLKEIDAFWDGYFLDLQRIQSERETS